MLRLTTFGELVLRQNGAPHVGAASLRSRLAVLVLAASAGRGTISRDKLIGYLWPGSDPDHARHALRQSLHALQRALGTEALFLGTEVLQLNPARITSDLQDVEDAIASGAHERVIALCSGPFLDGYVLTEATAFKRWVEAQRARFAAARTAALEVCAERAAAYGGDAAALAWWRQLFAEQPISSRYALGTIRALAASGDRTGALYVASLHQSAVYDELGVDADVAVRELVDRLRAANSESGSGAPPAGTRSAVARRLATARGEARDRQRASIEHSLGERYVVEAGLLAGGVTTAITAYDRERGARVQIHLLDPGVVAMADLDRLGASLERLASLRHPRLVPVHEIGHAEGVVYYVAAVPEGDSLRDVLARERQMPVREALVISDDIAAGLAYAHDAGVLHADLRPKHVYVAARRATVAQIGVTQALAAAAAGHDHTSAALQVSSPAYQSPEQIVGERALDARTDVYSLGSILYEMLAGEVPFASANRGHLASSKLTSPAAALKLRRDTVGTDLERVVQRCLARAPSDRYRSAGELRAALEALLNGALL